MSTTKSISTGSIIKYDVIFSIPVNNDFSKIVITDTLSNGLTAISAVVTVNETVTGTPAVTVVTVPNNFTITLNSSIATTNAVKAIHATLTVLVNNAATFLAAIAPPTPGGDYVENIAYILPYGNDGNPLPDSADYGKIPQDFLPCTTSFYGFGSSTVVDRVADESAPLITAIPGMYSFGNPQLYYKFVITPAPELTFTPGPGAVTAYVGSSSNSVDSSNIHVAYDSGANIITVTIPHADNMKASLLYVVSNTKTNASIASVPAGIDLLTSHADLSLIYIDQEVCKAPHFTATTALSNNIPKLTASKIIL